MKFSAFCYHSAAEFYKVHYRIWLNLPEKMGPC